MVVACGLGAFSRLFRKSYAPAEKGFDRGVDGFDVFRSETYVFSARSASRGGPFFFPPFGGEKTFLRSAGAREIYDRMSFFF